MNIDIGLKSLEKFRGNKQAGYLEQILFPQRKEMTVFSDRLLLGEAKQRDKHTGDRFPYWINCNEVFHMTLLGQTRLGGKTSLLRRIMDTTFLSGWACCWLDDVKNEMRLSKEPQTGKLLNYLNKNDIPQGIPLKVFRFKFFSKFFGEKLPPDNEEFVIGFKDVTQEELFFMLGFNKMSNKDHRDVISILYNQVNSLKELRERVEKDSKIKKGVKRDILNSVNTLIHYDIFGEVTTPFTKLFNEMVVVFNIQGYENIGGRELPTFPTIYLKIITRMIVEAKEKHIIKRKRMSIIIDEAREFFESKDNIMYGVYKEVIAKQTYLGIHVITSFQDIEQMKDAVFILNQSRFILFAGTMPIDDIKKLYEQKGVVDFHPSWKRDLAEIIQSNRRAMPAGWKMWGIIDKMQNTKYPDYFVAYASLSKHMLSQI